MKNLHYLWCGVIALGVFCLFCKLFANKWLPWKLAKGEATADHNTSYSASLLQMVIFTMLTIFAYATVFAARIFENDGAGLLPSLKDGSVWLGVPINLLLLMGVSVGTAVASRAIKVSQQENRTLREVDNSSLTTYRDGRTDLVKIQMLIWTTIAVFVYIAILCRFMTNECFGFPLPDNCPKNWGNSLPDIDTAFLVLLGISQGGQVVNQLSESSKDSPQVIAKIVIEPSTTELTTSVPTKQLIATATDAQDKTIPNLPNGTLEWKSDKPDIAEVDKTGLITRKAVGDCNITANANAISSNQCKVNCI